jgi:biotin carboxyl carrier protein
MGSEISIDRSTAKVELSRLREEFGEVYEANIGATIRAKVRIRVEKREPDALLVSIDDKAYYVKQLSRTANAVHFLLNGSEVKAVIDHTGKYSGVARSETKSDVASVNELVSSNFPAKVVSVPVKKGSLLKEGDTILVLEAMKMEARIKAPKDCKVVEVFVHEGDMVGRGSKLAQLKFS